MMRSGSMSTWMAWTVGGGGALTPTDLTGYVVTKDDANSVSLAAGPGSEPYGVIVGVFGIFSDEEV